MPRYRSRRISTDKFVVPHNRAILEDWNGHSNVEFAGSALQVMYLYKYLYKGSKKAKVTAKNIDNKDDEISL